MDILAISDSTLRGTRSRATLGVIEILFGGLGIVAEVIFYVIYRRYNGPTYLESDIILQMALGIANSLGTICLGDTPVGPLNFGPSNTHPFGSLSYSVRTTFCEISSSVSNGVVGKLLLVAGVLGICSKRKLWVVIVNMVFNIISASECIIWGVFLGIVTSRSWSYYWYDLQPTGFYFVTLSFLDMALFLNFVTAVIGASFTCTAFCPCVAGDTEGQFVVYNNAFRITPHVPPLHDETTSPLLEPNLDPPRSGFTSFKATSYGAV